MVSAVILTPGTESASCLGAGRTEAWRSDDEEPIEVVGDQVIWPQGTYGGEGWRVKVGIGMDDIKWTWMTSKIWRCACFFWGGRKEYEGKFKTLDLESKMKLIVRVMDSTMLIHHDIRSISWANSERKEVGSRPVDSPWWNPTGLELSTTEKLRAYGSPLSDEKECVCLVEMFLTLVKGYNLCVCVCPKGKKTPGFFWWWKCHDKIFPDSSDPTPQKDWGFLFSHVGFRWGEAFLPEKHRHVLQEVEIPWWWRKNPWSFNKLAMPTRRKPVQGKPRSLVGRKKNFQRTT